MRMPLASKTKQPRTQAAKPKSVPAPLKGWNTRDALAEMDPMEAVVLDNWFPRTSFVEIRGGSSEHATGMTNNGKTLMVYNAIAGTAKLFCSTASGIYDVSAAGAVGASVLARTNGKHQWVMFGDGSSNWLIACNGVDAPAYYDGSTWTAVTGATSPALTGVTTTDLVSVNVFKGRLFFIQKASMSFWYLDAGLAGGALTEFDLSGEAKKGGFLMAMATWTRDAGDGLDDLAVFITSEGEAIVYQGTNPSSSSNWAKVGTFVIGRPIGRRCIEQVGADCVILTENGTFPLSSALQSAGVDAKLALSFKIEPTFTESARTYGSTFGWEAKLFPAQNALIVNVPVAEDGEHQQYVMNTITKAWCRFLEWDAECFAVFNKELYFANGTSVYKAWTTNADLGGNIEAYAKQAFNYFDSVGQLKTFKLFRPVLSTDGSINYLVDVDVDFQDDPITGTASYAVVAGMVWDEDNWDEAYWAAGQQVVKQWSSVAEYPGFCAAGKLKVATNTLTVSWASSDFVYEHGGIL